MEPKEREATSASIDYIANNIHDVSLLFPKLVSKFLIERDDRDLIKSQVTGRMKITTLIEILHEKEGAFFAFLEILIAEKKKFVAKKIYEEYTSRGGTVEMSLDETEKILKERGWDSTLTAFRFPQSNPPAGKTTNTGESNSHTSNPILNPAVANESDDEMDQK